MRSCDEITSPSANSSYVAFCTHSLLGNVAVGYTLLAVIELLMSAAPAQKSQALHTSLMLEQALVQSISTEMGLEMHTISS
jgi:hypothetical protein